jgi:DNA-binding NarL/FixJ family response regulator
MPYLNGQPATVWLDVGLPGTPAWTDPHWQALLRQDTVRWVAAASNPQDQGGIAALDAGCAAYCHAFADAATLTQLMQVVQAGNIWIGKSLMRRLLHGTRELARSASPGSEWDRCLTQWERELAILAANGGSNQTIASDCNMSEQAVKEGLTACNSHCGFMASLHFSVRRWAPSVPCKSACCKLLAHNYEFSLAPRSNRDRRQPPHDSVCRIPSSFH